MIVFQKVIKNVAIAFACFLIVSIVSICFMGLYYLGNIFTNEKNVETKDLKEVTLKETNSNKIKIELASSTFIIKEGTNLKLESNHSKITAKEENGYLKIKEQKNWNINKTTNQMVLTLPNNQVLEYLEIETGAGLFEIESLKVNELDLDLGAGKVIIDNLEVYRSASIDGGLGEIIVNKSKINNLELNMGIGKLTLNANIFGNSKIEAGVGNIDLNLLGNKEIYTLKLEKGLGSVQVDGKRIENNTFGTGLNVLNVEGGIGAININFKERGDK